MKLKLFFFFVPLLCAFALLAYLMPTKPMSTTSVTSLSKRVCTNPPSLEGYSAAYQVSIQVKAEYQQRLLYQSELSFKQQLQQVSENRIFGKASDIKLIETHPASNAKVEHSLVDVLILSKARAEPYLAFTEFNDLGLPAQHPLSVLSQLLKNLSVDADGQTTLYAFDPLKRQYQYRQSSESGVFLREWLTPDMTALSPTQAYSHWQMTLGEDCLPEQMTSEESAPFSTASDGFIRFTMQAKRIPDVENLRKVRFSPDANQNIVWQVTELGADLLEEKVTSEVQSFAILERVHRTKNTGQLMNAVNYLIEHEPVHDLVDLLTAQTLNDVVWRNLFYGLGVSTHPEAEPFLLDMLSALPAQGETPDELNKVRIMVAASNRHAVSAATFETLNAIAQNNQQSANARRNALINQGTVVQHMIAQGQDAAVYRELLSANIQSQLEQPAADAAIFSAGNAGLIQTSSKIANLVVNKLQKGNEKERYASATVLLNEAGYIDELLNHLASETSLLVSGVILTGIDADTLTDQQIQQLKHLSAEAELPEQTRRQLNRLIGA